MCGVIGYVGSGVGPEFFFQGLKRLEYRGYDSSGIAMLSGNEIHVQRSVGKLSTLEPKLVALPKTTRLGIGHTRWATHGKPSENNAHPHRAGSIVLLHNGIIENYRALKTRLMERGCTFLSETDTEVAAHLLSSEYEAQPKALPPRERMFKAIYRLIEQIQGAYAFGIMCLDTPDLLYTVKYGSPVIVGKGDGANYIASGITALVEHTKHFAVLDDGAVGVLSAEAIEVFDAKGTRVEPQYKKVEWSAAMMEKGGYRHFMLKEIFEQPIAVAETLGSRLERDAGRIRLNEMGMDKLPLKDINRIQIVACGSSFYAGLTGRYFIESLTRIPVEVELASEYRYRVSTADSKTLVIAISQSGETADTLQAIKFAKGHGAKVFAIVNVPESSIAHVADVECLTFAGPEVCVATTKAFSAQLVTLMMFGIGLAQIRESASAEVVSNAIDELVKIPSLLERSLSLSQEIEKMSNKYHEFSNMLFIGRGHCYPVALEGALKLKEISYIHAQAYPGGELKHGPIALVDENMPIVCLAPKDSYYDKMISDIEEVKARGGKIIALGTEGDKQLMALADDFLPITQSSEWVIPFLTAIPLQLFAYWIAVRKGTDVDQPRNLAKSVTVE